MIRVGDNIAIAIPSGLAVCGHDRLVLDGRANQVGGCGLDQYKIDISASHPGSHVRVFLGNDIASGKIGGESRAACLQVGNDEISEGVGIGLRPRIEAEMGIDPLDVGFRREQNASILTPE